jgi:hypothetical protein
VTDPTVLNASSVDFTGALINPCPPNIVCVLPPAGAPGVVRVVETASGSGLAAPVTGRLFAITYNIVGLISGTGITLPSVQVTGVVNGVVTAIPENIQGAGFSNVNMPFQIFVEVSPGFLSLPIDSATTTSIASTNFAGRVKLLTTVTPTISNRPTATLSANFVTLPTTVTLTVTAKTHTTPGNYIVSVTLTNNGLSGNLQIPVTVLS